MLSKAEQSSASWPMGTTSQVMIEAPGRVQGPDPVPISVPIDPSVVPEDFGHHSLKQAKAYAQSPTMY